MYKSILEKRGERDFSVEDFSLIESKHQNNFNKLMRVLTHPNIVLIFDLDDDVDGFTCVKLFIDVIRLVNPNIETHIFKSKEKHHGVNTEFVYFVQDIIQTHNMRFKPVVMLTDSSSDNLLEITQLSQISDIVHIDHHVSHNEEFLSKNCVFHANCRYEQDSRFHNLSAGMYISFFLTNYLKTTPNYSYDIMNSLLSLGLLSLVADACDTQLEYHKTLIKKFRDMNCIHPLLQCYTTKWTQQNLYFLGFTVAPKINMLFRLRYVDLVHKLLLARPVETADIVDEVAEIYKDYKSCIDLSLGTLDVIDYGKFGYVDITGINKLYTIFKDKIVNFTGWYANKISEFLGKPCIAVCQISDSMLKGSVRSATGDTIYNLMNNLDYIEGGGHPSAYGFTMYSYLINNLLNDFNDNFVSTVRINDNLAKIDRLEELIYLQKEGILDKFCKYNEYTLSNRIGFLYTLKPSDNLKKEERRLTLSLGDMNYFNLVGFDQTITDRDTIQLIPEYNQYGVKFIFNKVGNRY